MSQVHLVPICLSNASLVLPHLSEHLGRVFHGSVLIHPLRFDPEAAFNSSRGQYNSTNLLKQLLDADVSGDGHILGVASVDLFIPILTYVFGEAQLDGRAAVVSSYRLQNTLYGLPDNQRLLLDRLLKEATHELGHTYGLVHCPEPICVMHSSTYVEDIDLKSAQFCETCARAIRSRHAG